MTFNLKVVAEKQGRNFKDLERRMREFPVQDPEPCLDHDEFLLELGKEHFDVLQKIWGNNEQNNILTANALQHTSLFLVPEVIRSAHAIKPNRYRNDNWFPIETGRVAHSIGKAVGIYNPKFTGYKIKPLPDNTRHLIYMWHLSGKDKRKWNPALWGATGQGIPHVAMGYSIYEMLRAAELLTEGEGVELSDREREINFTYFGQILQRAGFHFPNSRATMEETAQEVDTLAEYNPMVAELIDRTVRTSFGKNPGATYLMHASSVKADNLKACQPVTLEIIDRFLRPKSKEIFRKIAQEYDFEAYETTVVE